MTQIENNLVDQQGQKQILQDQYKVIEKQNSLK